MYQAIHTKYIGPRAVRGSRVKASSEAGSITLTWDDGLSDKANHAAAARALLAKFGWRGVYVMGGNGPGAYVWVHAIDHRDGEVTFNVSIDR